MKSYIIKHNVIATQENPVNRTRNRNTTDRNIVNTNTCMKITRARAHTHTQRIFIGIITIHVGKSNLLKSVVKSRRRFYYTHCKRLCYVATSNVLFALIDFVPSLSQRIIASHLILNLIERSLAFTRSSDRLIDNELLVKYIFFATSLSLAWTEVSK